MMTTVEPIDELLQQKKLECQEKLNKTNESFEPGKPFYGLYKNTELHTKFPATSYNKYKKRENKIVKKVTTKFTILAI